MNGAMTAEYIRIAGHGGDEIAAYLARPSGPGPFPGVLVNHHGPGWDGATKEIVRRFAAEGHIAISPHLYHREGPDASPDDAAAAARAKGGVPDERYLGDAAAAIARIRKLDGSNGKVGAIGYCSGGRQTFLAACNLELDAAVDCYGGFVAEAIPPEIPFKMAPIIDQAPNLRCPLLGLFGAEDLHPAPAETRRIEEVLKQHGKTFEFHTFEGAGHSFFAVDRPAYRVAAATEGWKLVFEWFGRYLG